MSVQDRWSPESNTVDAEVVEIRKYSNRRLYDTSASRYIKLTDVEDMIRQGKNIRVVDAQTGEDLTKSVMLQIICESKTQQEVLPVGFLRQVIQASGKTVRNSLQEFLSIGLQAQREVQQQVSQWMKTGATLNPFLSPLSAWFSNTVQHSAPPPPVSSRREVSVVQTSEESKDAVSPQNTEVSSQDAEGQNSIAAQATQDKDSNVQQEIEMMRQQLALLQKQIDRISKS